jgi:hypothetical protein
VEIMRPYNEIKNRFRLSFISQTIVILTFFHLAFIILFDKVTAFAPDEANYIGVFDNLYRSDFSLDGYAGWQEGSINALRIVYFPAKLMLLVGFSDFFAIRILAILYSIFSLYLLLKLAPEKVILRIPIRFWLAGAYFIPSIFLWSSLGLRESFIFFSFIAIFYLMVNPQNLPSGIQFLLLASVSAFFLVSKVYLFGLLLICLLTSIVVISIGKRKIERKTLKLFWAFLIPLLLLPTTTTNLVTGATTMFEDELYSPATTLYGGTPTIDAGGQTLIELNRQLNKNPILYRLTTITGAQSFLERRLEESYLQLSSKELSKKMTQRQTQPASLRDPPSILVGVYNFLFVPTPFVDNGSFFLNAQSYESFLWYFYYLILIILLVGLIRGHYVLNIVTLSLSLFSIGFIAMSALIEINDGTSVRHRAVFLIGILIMLATFQRRQPDHLEHQSSKF